VEGFRVTRDALLILLLLLSLLPDLDNNPIFYVVFVLDLLGTAVFFIKRLINYKLEVDQTASSALFGQDHRRPNNCQKLFNIPQERLRLLQSSKVAALPSSAFTLQPTKVKNTYPPLRPVKHQIGEQILGPGPSHSRNLDGKGRKPKRLRLGHGHRRKRAANDFDQSSVCPKRAAVRVSQPVKRHHRKYRVKRQGLRVAIVAPFDEFLAHPAPRQHDPGEPDL